MTIPRPLILLVLGPLCFAAGCAQPIRTDRTFRRGVEALAAGSPKAAIPFLTEAVASSPDDAEAHAMLAVAYALALEPDLAIQMVKRVHPDPGTIETPGWEHVALGIAAVVQHRPEDAAEQLRKVADTASSPADAKQAASQWLTLTLLLKGEWSGAGLSYALASGRRHERRPDDGPVVGGPGSCPPGRRPKRPPVPRESGRQRLRATRAQGPAPGRNNPRGQPGPLRRRCRRDPARQTRRGGKTVHGSARAAA